MDIESLLTKEQKEGIILTQLGMDTTRDDVGLRYDARYGWDFCVARYKKSQIRVTFSVCVTDMRFKAVLEQVHRAIHEVRQGQMMIQGTEREVVLKGNGKLDLTLRMKLTPELSKALREKAYEAGFHASVGGVKKFLEREYLS